MSLTATDLQQIKIIMRDTIHETVPTMISDAIRPLQGEIAALRNDVKEIYIMLDTHEHWMKRTGAHLKIPFLKP